MVKGCQEQLVLYCDRARRRTREYSRDRDRRLPPRTPRPFERLRENLHLSTFMIREQGSENRKQSKRPWTRSLALKRTAESVRRFHHEVAVTYE